MKILYLCARHFWERKIPRTRFHAIEALSDIAELKTSGSGFSEWHSEWSVSDNVAELYGGGEPDYLIVYKPLDYFGWSDVETPVCTIMNDMWDTNDRCNDILMPGCKLVICHHENEVEPWRERLSYVRFEHIPYPVSLRHFTRGDRDFKDRQFDVLLTGDVTESVYPLRARFKRLIESGAFKPLIASYRKHPGYRLRNPDKEVMKYAAILGNAKIGLFDTSIHRYWPEKINEYVACGVVPVGNLPNQDHEEFNCLGLVIYQSWSDMMIVERIKDWLADEELLENKAAYGEWYVQERSMESYAKRLLDVLSDTVAVP